MVVNGSSASRARRESQLVRALGGMFALAEAYPDLKARQRFAMLQQDLAEIEDGIQYARRYYNAVVRDLNTVLAKFPNVLVARFFAFRRRPFFELDDPSERRAATVQLDDDN